MKRTWKKLLGFGWFKGILVRFSALALKCRPLIPRFAFQGALAWASLTMKAFWFFPLHPWRRSARNILALGAAGDTPRRIFFRLVDGCRFVALAFLDAHRLGVEGILPRIRMTDKARQTFEDIQEEGGRAIVVLPHVLGGIFSAALVSKRYPTMILSRGPRNPKRAEIQRDFMKPLELELLVLDRSSAVKAARQFLSALKKGRLIVGTTDLDYKRDDSVEATFYGQTVHLPSWPARFARQAKAPILPGFVRVKDEAVEIDLGEPIRERDLARATQAWADAFQASILSAPWDWAFLCDRRWGKLLDRAAREGRSATP